MRISEVYYIEKITVDEQILTLWQEKEMANKKKSSVQRICDF
jgi:hypothetical protein